MRLTFAIMMIIFIIVFTGAVPNSSTAAFLPSATRTMGYGMLALDPAKVSAAGFNWIKVSATWKDLEPSAGGFSGGSFSALNTTVEAARAKGLSVMLAVQRSPSWATGSGSDTAPPINDNDFADFMGYLATYFKGRVAAYEIWNEPNLHYEWGMRPPDPVKFASMLRALYPRVKAADPSALVITGGLSTAGDSDPTTGASDYGDLLWISRLYTWGNVRSCSDGTGGLRSCFDALGSHPYGGKYAPETAPLDAQYDTGMYFRRVEQQKQMMDVHGADYNTGIWVTEFNWLIDPAAFGTTCNWGSGWDRYKLSGNASSQEATQADYLRRAYNYAYTNWPWLQGMILFNMDYYQRDSCDQVIWYALTRKDGTLRPAYYTLQSMAKPGIVSPVLKLSANQATFLISRSAANTSSRTIQLSNGNSGPLAWSATAAGGSWLKISTSVNPTLATSVSGTVPAGLIITVNKSGLANGTYSGTVTLTAAGASNSPQQVQVKLYVGTVHQVGVAGQVQKNN